MLDIKGTHFLSGYIGEKLDAGGTDPYSINTGINNDGNSRDGNEIRQIQYIKV